MEGKERRQGPRPWSSRKGGFLGPGPRVGGGVPRPWPSGMGGKFLSLGPQVVGGGSSFALASSMPSSPPSGQEYRFWRSPDAGLS
jgi:hypothetical protein